MLFHFLELQEMPQSTNTKETQLKVTVIGAGLSGSEAAHQIASKGIYVDLYEMRPRKTTKAHKTGLFSELVCSNSFRGADLTNAVGLLKEELKLWHSLIMEAALFSQVPAGGALAVDREKFSTYVDHKIRSNPLINIIEDEVTEIPTPSENNPVIVASGPLTSEQLCKNILELSTQGNLSFFDAISPIILGSSICHDTIFRQSRYDKGEGSDYLNIPLSKEEYEKFINDVLEAEKFGGHEEVESDNITNLRPFEGCMPIEDMAERGLDTLRFGPMKPVGLTDPRTGRRPYAVIQLRQDDSEGHLWSMVGFQTRMKHNEQLRVLKSLPGLEEAEFVRLGSVHRNTFIDSPKLLNPTLEYRTISGLFFAGQITGTEGYVESTAGGLIAGINAVNYLNKQPLFIPPTHTAIGGLLHYISDPAREYFQPMNISFGLIPAYGEALALSHKKSDKKEIRMKISKEALATTEMIYSTQ